MIVHNPHTGLSLSSPIAAFARWTSSFRHSRSSRHGIRRTTWQIGAALSDLLLLLVLLALMAGLESLAGIFVTKIRWEQGLLPFGLLTILLFIGMAAARGDYAQARGLSAQSSDSAVLKLWGMAFCLAATLGFFLALLEGLSRLQALSFLLFGGVVLALNHRLVRHCLRAEATKGRLSLRRIFLVGYENEIAAFQDHQDADVTGMQIVTASVLRGRESLEDDLKLAAATARLLRPDDIFILVPWGDSETIDPCVSAFRRVPAALHLGSENALRRYSDARVVKMGSLAGLTIEQPWSGAKVVAKRSFDSLMATLALLLLAPLFAVVAIGIKLDSAGPVLFRQRRYGFNQEPFAIFKFRTMNVREDGRHVEQAKAADPRVTKLGRFLRRWNIDELPQLLNVLLGDMSLVGPRPHAMAHDQMFEREVTLYARRHNVRPGITGWAQINGLRGKVDQESLRRRIEHDLFYIDHWTIWLDIKILWCTIMSRKAYENAR
ncbi:exopolysaccharide biosynthesis polyprenyl glycosylphosphotransferase [Beijerinckia indica]|uniref:Exopolysaccharide biosynthesis polyprenyl glycosylphosphotransferase n=1 Tax=Beijerinckia indica subsp. indica (strain ATCC 9039 / DSM 1715 / NCIMB 8712) TaxID=395963 RepID=B2IGC3_BEII9|nr:exopolysaccharide biosynthesis polyprenyl glycosylphosphotransferase [Beijerinckia indica]ACB94308.1 exopolysaccharide biosynthesis polyprenyl glycosylphosphotransferase [Beijerinckia indica subsp. indica ATCC 9039]